MFINSFPTTVCGVNMAKYIVFYIYIYRRRKKDLKVENVGCFQTLNNMTSQHVAPVHVKKVFSNVRKMYDDKNSEMKKI
jgi:hypothetical protein